ncbi:PAN domain-containing protein [Rhizobium sp. LC145]|uniref:PAN domain-containing protein n=1 Tax=Rhizobium sp. LC145 TaxID=1120688 RepID=UPI000A7A8F2A|nr:PAN domain-containing protein [Rhizobium sp. LC145]
MRNRLQVAFAGVMLSLLSVSGASAAVKTFGPFSVDDANPGVIALNGDIDVNSGLNFRRALQAAPNAKLVTLNSPGGNVQMGLLIADDIHQRKLATYISKESKCFSACSFVFLAGAERKVDGALGVHQISSDSPDLVGAQLAISDIIEVLNRFGTPIDVMHIMFKTPPNDMHVFSQEEVAQYKLNRAAGYGTPAEGAVDAPASIASVDAKTHEQTASGNVSTETDVASVAPEASQLAKLSPLEEFTRRPNRIAVYTGLDLFGDDISSIRATDAGECAKSCLVMDGQCKAFTFNANPKIKRGPNCFLKASAGRADGNSVAFSGRFLSGAESDPPALTLGTIDPTTALYDDIDLPGGDLSRRPERAARTPLDCRLACIDEKSCVAFTYIKPKKECWLKGSIGTPTFGKGMVSGLKKLETFAPAKIISLNE